jgi:hypothetical protein
LKYFAQSVSEECQITSTSAFDTTGTVVCTEGTGGLRGVIRREFQTQRGCIAWQFENKYRGVVFCRDEAVVAVDGINCFNFILKFFGHCSGSEGLIERGLRALSFQFVKTVLNFMIDFKQEYI